jgi:hypothetical protein
VALVVAIFILLRSFRSTLIPFVTIPVSLIGSIFFAMCSSFSINVLTLLGVVLAIGLVSTMPSSCWRTVTGTWRWENRPRRPPPMASRDRVCRDRDVADADRGVRAGGVRSGQHWKLFAEFRSQSAVAVSGFIAPADADDARRC